MCINVGVLFITSYVIVLLYCINSGSKSAHRFDALKPRSTQTHTFERERTFDRIKRIREGIKRERETKDKRYGTKWLSKIIVDDPEGKKLEGWYGWTKRE